MGKYLTIVIASCVYGYGHAQHRLVNIAVRQLAVEAGLDVWALGTRMPIDAGEQSQYVNVAGELGLPTIEGYFDPKLFREVRGKYLARIPTASTPQLTAKFRSWSATLWTWSDKPEAFPTGWRPFVKLVDKGVDLTIENSAVKQLENDVMIFNDRPANPTLLFNQVGPAPIAVQRYLADCTNREKRVDRLKTAWTHLKLSFAEKPAVEVTPRDIVAYVTSRREVGRTGGRINRELAVMKAAFRYGARSEMITRIPMFPKRLKE